jgi:SnoaL-like domain
MSTARPRDAEVLEQCHHALVEIWFDIDHRDGSRVSSWFTPTARLRIGGHEVRGTAEIDALYAARYSRGVRTARHLIGNVRLVECQPDRASVLSALTLYAEGGTPPHVGTAPAMAGDVRDEFELAGGRWLIASRDIVTLFVAPDATFAVPGN